MGNAAQPDQAHPQCLRASEPVRRRMRAAIGYAEYLEALSDPEHDRHRELLGRRGKFDAEPFDLAAVNRALQKAFE